MFGLLADKDWLRDRSRPKPRHGRRGRPPTYLACIVACGLLLVIGGILLANADIGGRSDPPPTAAKARIRLM